MPTVLQIADEYLERHRRGERPTPDEYANRYPELADELRVVLPMVTLLESSVPADILGTSETLDAEVDATAGGSHRQDSELPECFGRYRIIRPIGHGAMGKVYLAHDTQLHRNVALKVPSFDAKQHATVERFYREARAMAAVEHPGLCPIYDVGEIDGGHFLAMAFVDGVSLSEVLRNEPTVENAQAAELVRKIARSVQVAHEAGIIHRDLKPGNVMLNKHPASRQSDDERQVEAHGPTLVGEPIVMDFGLAWSSHEGDAELTQAGMVVGTPAYMSPEQINAGRDQVGPATDVYALGVILYRLLCGRCPFEGPVVSMLHQIAHEPPAKPSSYRPDIDPALEAICLNAMAKQVEHRYASAAELANALDGYLDRKITPATPLGDGLNQRIVAMTLLAVLLVAFAAFATWLIKTPYGEVVVHAPEDARIEVALVQNGEVAQIVGPDDGWSVKIGEGTYEVSLRPLPGAKANEVAKLSLKNGNTVTVSRDGRADITIVHKPLADGVAAGPDAKRLTIANVANANPPDTSHLLPPRPAPSTTSSGELIDSGQRLGSSDSRAIQLGDLDGDGDLDAFVGCHQTGANLVWLNDGSGRFSDSGQRLGLQGNFAVTLGDVDSDGDLDAVTGVRFTDATAEVWLNNGEAVFSLSQQDLVAAHHGALGDVDGDGDLDLFLARRLAPNRVLWNDGTGRFTDSGQRLGDRSSMHTALGDLDNDGDLDAYVCNTQGGRDAVYRNDGTGHFEEWATTQTTGESAMAALLDWNDDGYLDVAVCRWGHFLELLLNDGDGRLEHGGFNEFQFPYTGLRAGDLDGDASPELLAIGSVFIAMPVVVVRHRPSHDFRRTAEFFGQMNGASIDIGDLDGDGDLDAYIANHSGAPDQVWLNRGSDEPAQMTFVQSEQSMPGHNPWNVVVADLDGDEDVDMFVPGQAGQNRVWLNDGDGHFTDTGQQLKQQSAMWANGGDLDGDGDVDVLVSAKNAPDVVWLNDGAGVFSASELEPANQSRIRNSLADVDSDGDLDAFVVVQNGNDVVLLNDGKGRLTEHQELPGWTSVGGAVGDIDNDGSLDFVVSSNVAGEPLRIWLGDGQGDFALSDVSIPRGQPGAVSLADLNDDGKLDLLTGGSLLLGTPHQIYFGDGTGEFTASGQPLAAMEMSNAVAGDVDLDGDTDLIIANHNGNPNQLLLNDANGVFRHKQWMGNSHSSVQLADVDGDGDLDVVEAIFAGGAQGSGSCQVWFNQTIP